MTCQLPNADVVMHLGLVCFFLLGGVSLFYFFFFLFLSFLFFFFHSSNLREHCVRIQNKRHS
jgi:hypothetical protein